MTPNNTSNPVASAPMRSGATSEVARLSEQIRVLAARRGDVQAFTALIDSYERRLLYYVRRFTRDSDQALEVLQDVWLTVFRQLPRLRSPAAFRGWLYRIAHDRVVSLMRGAWRRADEELAAAGQAYDPDDAGNDNAVAHVENAELVHRALTELSAPHREVLTLRFLEEMTLDEIAGATGENLGTIKSRMHYAKAAFKKEVERLNHE